MCSRPKMPAAPPPPPPPQEAKTPDATEFRKARRASQQSGMAGGTLLTGPSGIEANMLNTGGNTLLGR